MAGKIFFVADTHFGHEAMIRFENRPFKDIRDMEQKIIKELEETVSPGGQGVRSWGFCFWR